MSNGDGLMIYVLVVGGVVRVIENHGVRPLPEKAKR